MLMLLYHHEYYIFPMLKSTLRSETNAHARARVS